MGKGRSWFGFVKRLFIPESRSKEEKKSKRWRCVFWRIRMKQHHPAIEEVVPERTLNDANEEQRKYALAVAVATAAAAEAAVAAATAAAEVVRLTGFPDELDKRHQNSAAIKIQSIYRAHLARKALRALKGVVRLQAVIRGQLVRRQIISQLRSLQSITKIHPKVHQIRVPIFDNVYKNSDREQSLSPRKELEKKEVKLECGSGKNLDYAFFPKLDKEIIWSQKLETDMKRERMKKYSFSHRERSDQSLEEIITMKADRSHHFEQRAGVKACQLQETEKKRSTANPNSFDNEPIKVTNEKLRNGHKQQSVEDPNSPCSLPRRSFCRTKRPEYSTGSDDSSLPNSPVFPSYMATTESAKAKARSLSTPKQRLTLLDIYSAHSSSSLKPKLTSWSSFKGEFSSASDTSQHISLRTKHHSQDLKSHSFGF